MSDLRLIDHADWPAVHAVQTLAYPDFLHEPLSVLRDKQRLGPHSCWCARVDGRVQAYLLAHPWAGEDLPCWGQDGQPLSGKADQLFLHDLAIAPAAQGRGIAGRLLAAAEGQARAAGLSRLTLIAVQGAAGYWARHGFAPLALASPLPAAYGREACAMARPLLPA
ncbi:GNAT family N-acetyltransferase [Chitinilyticum litopenaei]|uniref:GNAT family N-acetyltransferase n=1 Tax=Chitinilyticum litopenaei TaxID=1121276 RepID=UPI0004001B5E|nr:GNAT family N-acetyltransferase [Chitinilyticum litopenaei]